MLFATILTVSALVVSVTQARHFVGTEARYKVGTCGFFDDEKLKDKPKQGWLEIKSLCAVDWPVEPIGYNHTYLPEQFQELEDVWAEVTATGRMQQEPTRVCAKDGSFCITWSDPFWGVWDREGHPTGTDWKDWSDLLLEQMLTCTHNNMRFHAKFVVDGGWDFGLCVGVDPHCSIDTYDEKCLPMSRICHELGNC